MEPINYWSKCLRHFYAHLCIVHGSITAGLPGQHIKQVEVSVDYIAIAFLSTGMHLWKLKYGAFIRDAQIYYCRRLIVVPLSTFHRLAELIGDPKGELTFLFHVPRSGSTLLIQVVTPTGCIMLNVECFALILSNVYAFFAVSSGNFCLQLFICIHFWHAPL